MGKEDRTGDLILEAAQMFVVCGADSTPLYVLVFLVVTFIFFISVSGLQLFIRFLSVQIPPRE